MKWIVKLTRRPRVTRETAIIEVEATSEADACSKARRLDWDKLDWADVTVRGLGVERVMMEAKEGPK